MKISLNEKIRRKILSAMGTGGSSTLKHSTKRLIIKSGYGLHKTKRGRTIKVINKKGILIYDWQNRINLNYLKSKNKKSLII